MDAQSIYTLSDKVITIELCATDDIVYSTRIHVQYNLNSNPPISETLYMGYSYGEALNAYNQACASHVFLPDNKTSESGQGIILFIIAIVAIVVCLWIAYTGISEASTGTNNMFGYMLSRLGEVLR